jgi:flagellar hook-length control protein FliK
MNVNLSNVSATSKATVSESGVKTPVEDSESKGFFETLVGVFADSQKNQVPLVKSTIQASVEEGSPSVQSVQSEGESQETVTVDGKSEKQSTDALLAQDRVQETSDDEVVTLTQQAGETENKSMVTAPNKPVEADIKIDSDHDASEAMISKSESQRAKSDEADGHNALRSMDEGQQLLGRIEQANQTLRPQSQDTSSGKGLPPQTASVVSSTEKNSVEASDEMGLSGNTTSFVPAGSVSELSDRQAHYVQETQKEPGLEQQSEDVEDIVRATNMLREISGDSNPKMVQRISIEELEVIDTKLSQGKPLTSQEVDIIEGLKGGALVVDLTESAFAQLVALSDDVKVTLSESLTTSHSATRQTPAAVMTQQSQQVATPDMKHTALQPTVADKAALPAMPEALATASLNPAMQQVVVNTEMGHKGMSSALAAGTLKATADKQDKTEPQQGLAGQLQAVANQQGVTTPQQARAEAAQQAQLPLQLTKELANDQVAEKVQMMMSKNLKNLDIRLDPPELGRMQIRMTMNSDLANVHFTVTNPQARDIIEQTLPRLREMLAQQGMQLADSSVQQQSSGQQQSGYAAAEQNRQGAFGRGFSGESDDSFDADVELNVNVASPRDGISFYA